MSEALSSDDEERTTRWEGFSDYQSVSASIVSSIDDAIDSFATLQSLHVEGARVKPEQAARARANVLAAALRLVPELRDNADTSEIYQDILSRWLGEIEVEDEQITGNFSEYEGDNHIEDGFIEALNHVQIHTESPDWLHQFVVDIRTAGWELGYLQAGRTVSESNLEPADEQARDMFET